MYNKFQLIHLPRFKDKRGELNFFENFDQIPFEIDIVKWGTIRSNNDTHLSINKCEIFIIPLTGTIRIEIDEGTNKKHLYSLYKPSFGLYISALMKNNVTISTKKDSMVLLIFSKESR